MAEFVHLHLHTQYSLLDGAIKIKSLFPKAQEMGFKALAITDHGNMFGAVKFFQEATSHNIKPIIGCEMYIAPGSRFEKKSSRGGADAAYHLVLLAKDETGYKNLIKLVTAGYLEGFYYKPRIDKELLREHSQGLIALSACLKGEIPANILSGNYEGAKNALHEYIEIFGRENFYLELMRLGLEEQERVNEGLLELAKEENVQVVATNDCHYLNPEDAEAHDILLCVQTGKKVEETNRMRMDTNQLYLKSPEEMAKIFKDIPEAIENTVKIAEACSFAFKLNSEYHLPVYQVPEGYNTSSYLRKLAFEGLNRRKENGELSPNIPFEDYVKRLEYELSVIDQMGFPGYFLIVWDFVRFAKSNGIPVGPGRGSAAGSLVSYCLEITDIDPLRWGLLFERFLNPERVSMPDIDIDICKERRDLVIEYVKNRYGQENVAKIIAVGTLATRAVVRDVARALGFTPSEVDKIAKLFPPSGVSVEESIQLEPRIQEEMEKNPKIWELVKVASKLEGLCRQASTHAAGIVITPKKLTEYIPLYKNEKENEITTQYDKDDLEALGLLKMDLLGLRTLTVIDTTLKLIETYKKEKVDLKHLPLDDEKTYRLLQSGQTLGVFQLESSGMRELLKRLKPSRFEDLIALVALYRPGPLGSGMVDDFIERKHGRKPIEYELPQLEPILAETYGVILYQEQVMKIASEIAGFSLGQADVLRKAMGKKKKDVMAQQREAFIKGAVERGVSKEKAEELFDKMAKFAEYGFNKSHSAAYAMVAYQTAYLKAHYPVEFMAALISSEINNTEKIYLYLNECKEMGIEVLPPDINESHVIFRIDGNSLRFGLAAIKGVGEAAAEAIVEARKDGPFESFYDFCRRIAGQKVNKKTIEALIKAGALDRFGDRNALLASVDRFVEAASKGAKSDKQPSLFEFASEEETVVNLKLEDAPPATTKEKLAMEKEALGFYLSGHPLDTVQDLLKRYPVTTIGELEGKEDGDEVILAGLVVSIREITTKNGDRMAFIGFEDKEGRTEIIAFPDVYREHHILFAMDEPILVKGTVTTDTANDHKKIIANEVATLYEGLKERSYRVVVKIPDSADEKEIELIKELALQYPGEMPLFLKVINSHYEVTIDTGKTVSNAFLRALPKEGRIKTALQEVDNGKAVAL